MSRVVSLAAAALTLAVAAPAVAATDTVDLQGAAKLRLIDNDRAALAITTDHELGRTAQDRPAVRITVRGRRVHTIGFVGQKNSGYRYAGLVRARGLEVGEKYTVRVRVPGQDVIVRKVKLLDARS